MAYTKKLTNSTDCRTVNTHRQPRLHEPHSVGRGVQQPQAAVGGHPAAEAGGVVDPGAAALGRPGELAYITLEDVPCVPYGMHMSGGAMEGEDNP